MIKVSIIVPVYNTGKYLKKCINSLINQTEKDIEIILLNDGSTDNSEDIIKSYKSKCNTQSLSIFSFLNLSIISSLTNSSPNGK